MEVFNLLTPYRFLISKCNLETRTCAWKSNLDNNNKNKIFTALIKTKKTMHCNWKMISRKKRNRTWNKRNSDHQHFFSIKYQCRINLSYKEFKTGPWLSNFSTLIQSFIYLFNYTKNDNGSYFLVFY